MVDEIIMTQDSTVSDMASLDSSKQYLKAQHNYTAQSARELSIRKGEILILINSANKEWWKVENQSGKQGFVPASYVKKLQQSAILSHPRRNASFGISLDLLPLESVQDKQESIKRKYSNLQRLANDRVQRLNESMKRFIFSREINELQHWVSDKAVFVSSEEAGKDLEHVEALKKRFDAFQADLSANEAKLSGITLMAESMVQEGHTDAEEIQREQEDVNTAWENLVQLTLVRKQQLEEAHDVQKFIRAADETKLWMNEKLTAVLSDDYGRDLNSIQALQKKHEGLERDLDALEEKVKSVSVESGALSRTYSQAARHVKVKEKEVMDAWNSLKDKAEARKVKLVDSHDLQQFLNEYRYCHHWYIMGFNEHAIVVT
jgi:spectrin alpha